MPLAWVNAMTAAIPGLRAEEEIGTFRAMALASGSLKKGDRQRVVREWRKSLAGAVKADTDPRQIAAKAAMMGLGVRLGNESR